MFTGLAIILALFLFPFMLGPAIPFHMIKEEKRYQEKIEIPFIEYLLLCCIGISFVLDGWFDSCLPWSIKMFLGDICNFALYILLGYYIWKITKSLITGEAISVFGLGPMTTKILKIGMLTFVIVVSLAVLENLNIISQ